MSSLAITGLGVISGYGVGATALMDGLMDNAVGHTRSVGALAPSPLCVGIAEAELAHMLSGERTRNMNRETLTLLAAARLALADAEHERFGGERDGIVVSTRHAGLQDYADIYRTGVRDGPRGSNPSQGPQAGLNAPASHLGIRLAGEGPNMTISNGSVGGLDALTYAAAALDSGGADTMLVCGVEVASSAWIDALPSLNARGRIPRPFDDARTGPVLGEAGVVAVLEHESVALERGVTPRARLGAVASAFSPRHDLAAALMWTLQSALERSPVSVNSLVGVVAGADGSVEDAAEARALYSLLGDHTPICAIQGGIANCGGASALAQLAVAVLALERRMLPPTVGFRSRGDVAPIRVLTDPQPVHLGPIVISARDEDCCAASAVLFPS